MLFVLHWQTEAAFTCFLWWLLRSRRPDLAPLLLFCFFIYDHTVYSLAYMERISWYIPTQKLDFYSGRMTYNLFILVLLNYNSLKLSLAVCPALFLVPEVIESVYFIKKSKEKVEN